MRQYGPAGAAATASGCRTWTTSTRASARRPGTPSWRGACPTCGTARASCTTARSRRAPASWADLWNARLKGRMTMLDDPEEVLGACLKKLGLPFSTTGSGGACAARSGRRWRRSTLLRAYLNAEVRDQLVAGDVLAAQLWSTTAQQAMDAAPRPGLRVSRARASRCTATARWCCGRAAAQELAHRFIDYLLRPRGFGGHRAGHAHGHGQRARRRRCCREADAQQPDALSAAGDLPRGEWPGTAPPAAQRLRDRLWTEIKSS